ncbi:methyltransferase family protein [Nafulsella turpanensis]|uniref:methyltransferase family protein n=1 Tax=Nafulsella turpanensis TaxID=1265690 RepID=UPI00047734DB|nr:isoprenylcysteine carboxylmethyltransferase family protein [Nafulsella turpanensis]
MKAAYFLLAILWLGYFSLHSLLARQWVKSIMKQRLNMSATNYRLAYSSLAFLGLIGILYYNFLISGERWFPPYTLTRFGALVLASWGVIVIRLSFRQYKLKAFLGLEPEERGEQLQTEGLLAYVRHPMYAGTILVALGFWLYVPTTANLITSLSIVVYILIGIQLEERSLEEKFGTEYLEYKKRVPMLIPFSKRPKGHI